jgi:striatin 1/3/4
MAWQSLSGMGGGGGNVSNGGEVPQPAGQPQGTEYTLQGMLAVKYDPEHCEERLILSRCYALLADRMASARTRS